MLDTLDAPAIRAVLGLLVLCVLCGVGFWLVSSLRGQSYDDRIEAEELLPKFEEMHREGTISDAEFRTIKSALAEKGDRESSHSNGAT